MTDDNKKGYTRREMLKITGAAGAGIAIGASGLGSAIHFIDQFAGSEKTSASEKTDKPIVSFYGKHQAGIITPQQTYIYLISFNLDTDSRCEVIKLFKDWTKLSELLVKGKREDGHNNDFLPPKDTGEAQDLGPAHLTITFGFGPTFFVKDGKDRFGLADKRPNHLRDIPHMAHDDLDLEICGGDVCVQACADDQQVAFHTVRNFIKSAIGTATVKWMKEGFISAPDGKTPRNLFGFKDGTANINTKSKEATDRVIWCDQGEPAWMKGGTYMAYRKIRMFLEVWDRSSLKDQEDTFGRKKDSGAAYGKIHEHDGVDMGKLPSASHVRLAHSTGQQIFRRAYSYTDEMDPKTGNVRAGLLFISFQADPDKQFIPMLRLLGQKDALNEYTKHVGSALFACPRGIRQGEYIAQSLLEGI